MITVVTPFSRIENKDFLIKQFEGKCHWVVLQASDEPVHEFPAWVTVKRFDIHKGKGISNRLLNEFFASPLDPEMQYMVLCDDDSIEEGFFDKIPDKDVVIVSMKRNEEHQHMLVDDWGMKIGHIEAGPDILWAQPDYLRVARMGGEQIIVKGKVLRNFRYGSEDSTADIPGDFKFISQVINEYEPTFVRDAFVLFNYFEDGRFSLFRRKPIVLFIGDYYCAGVPRMGVSEWETNIWKSLESTGLANITRFHFDKYYYTLGKRGDKALLQAIEDIKPDYVVLIIYKQPGSDPTVISLDTIANIKVPIISIWGDLEIPNQQALVKALQPFMHKIFGTANEEIVTRLGYTYMHVPKDPRIFNNPNKERDIDVLFNGSFGYGRPERAETLQYLINNGIKVVAGGSEGVDHFTTEEYADRYKRAKIAISFSTSTIDSHTQEKVNVVNARPFEVMLCGALLLEQESKEFTKLYTPSLDFVAWQNKEDLLKKIQQYLRFDLERQFIAQNGQKKTEELYSAKTFWEKVLL